MAEIRIFETHAHYTLPDFDRDREELLGALPGAGIAAVLNAAIDFESNEAMIALAKQYPFLYTAAGVHPKCVDALDEAKFRAITEMLDEERVIAVGETGLDYHKGTQLMKAQKYWFHRFLNLAEEKNMPLVIHTRAAMEDTLAILREHTLPSRAGVIHCFNDDYETAQIYLEMGFKLGVGGAFTKDAPNSARLDALRRVPREAIVLETDCPYLIPAGCPGGRNHSLYLPVILRALAELRGEREEELAEAAWENTLAIFPEMKGGEHVSGNR